MSAPSAGIGGRLPDDVVERARENVEETIGQHVELKRRGKELVGLCPFHQENTPSFTVSPDVGRFHCFGCGKNGDAIDFLVAHTGVDFRAAVLSITGYIPPIAADRKSTAPAKKAASKTWEALDTVPDTAPPAEFKHYRLGKPSTVWTYANADGEPVGYVCRFDTAAGKETLPMSWAVDTATGECAWRWLSFKDPRPLYGLDRLAQRPDAPVIVVEGEKTADAATRIFPSFVVVTWPGGGKAVHKAGWAPLAGRSVTLWPDSDWKAYKAPDTRAGQMVPEHEQPGVEAMRRVYSQIREQCPEVRIVRPVAGAPDGWDLADEAPFPDFDARAYAKANVMPAAEYFRNNSPPETETPTADGQAPAPAANDNRLTAQTVDWISPLPDANDKGRPVSTIENLAEICRRMGVVIRYNVITKEEEILIPGESFSIDNQANASLALLMSWCGRFRMPTGQLGDFVTYLADQHLYNPVARWIQSSPWDGRDRLQHLFDTVTAVGEARDSTVRKLKETMMRRWMISAVAGIFEPNGVSAHGVLVFQGPQYLGKTAWFKSLVPKSLNVIADGLMLKPDDRDSVKQAVSNWLVELGELDATFRKSDIAQLKSFLTRDKDVLRRAYARRESAFARRTVFFASVNPKEFLHDQTGNRRYWTIECEGLDHGHKIDMQQVWAQVADIYRSGEKWYLLPEEMALLNDANKSFEVIDPIAERIETRLKWKSDEVLWQYRTATDVLISVGIDRPTQSEATRAANLIRSLNGGRGKRTASGRLLLVPRAIGET